MNVVFRVDASLRMGNGHVMRCLALADALRELGANCTFISREHRGNLVDQIAKSGHKVLPLRQDDEDIEVQVYPRHASWLGVDWRTDAQQTIAALDGQPTDWLIVDHYALEKQWEQCMRPIVRKIMVIDDLADRPHDCDLLLDPNLGRHAVNYDRLLIRDTLTLLGPRYALLRPEFKHWRDYSLARRVQGKLDRILICMGGVDNDNVTGAVLEALEVCELPSGLQVIVVMGIHAPWLEQVRAQAANMARSVQVKVGVENMAELMADSDLCIGAAGSSTWERCCLGLPSIQVVLAANQEYIAQALDSVEAAVSLNASDIRNQLQEFFVCDQLKVRMQATSNLARQICKGQGAQIVAQFIGGEAHEDHATLQ